jgi:hypothetical protein
MTRECNTGCTALAIALAVVVALTDGGEGRQAVGSAGGETASVREQTTRVGAEPFDVALSTPDGWIDWGYGSLPRHQISRSAEGLRVGVNQSAGAIAYRLPAPRLVWSVRAAGRVDGHLTVSGDTQGQPGHDDYALRLGLVVKGDKRLGFFQRRFVPGWVRQLHDLAPAGAGISRVQFFAIGADASTVGRARQHPLHELLHEKVVAVLAPDGTFELSVPLDQPLETLGIWISTDGDDTASTFTLRLTSLTLG